ncbi:MAG: Fe-S cluster assembly protein SufD [Pseudomonadota bacterium]
MITLERQRSWFERQLAAATQSLEQAPPWLKTAQQQAIESAVRLPPLNRKQEAWRYTSIEGLLRNSFAASDGVARQREIQLDQWLLPRLDSFRVVLVNGHFSAQLSNLDELPSGVRIESLRTLLGADPGMLAACFGHTARHGENIFTALNTAAFSDGLFLRIARDVELQRPIEVIYLHSGNEQQLMQPRNLVVLEPGARATLIERFIGDASAPYFHNNLSEINLQRNAELRHYRLQQESRNAWHLGNLYLDQHRHSDYRGATLAFGGAWARTEYHLDFNHPHANCDLSGLYMTGDKQLTDFHLMVKHGVADCRSREQFKGIVYGEGRAVFDGHILVDRKAQRSDARLSNDNLMLTRNAEIDTKPQLEIYADDVSCSHGTTIGELDQQQLFYLRSRGIDEATACKLLCQGFAAEIIDGIAPEPLREHARHLLADTLDRVAFTGAGG